MGRAAKRSPSRIKDFLLANHVRSGLHKLSATVSEMPAMSVSQGLGRFSLSKGASFHGMDVIPKTQIMKFVLQIPYIVRLGNLLIFHSRTVEP